MKSPIGAPSRPSGQASRRRPLTRRFVLHVGSSKTGMRSIQFMLKNDRRQFLKHGILVPQTGQRPYGAHHGLAHDLAAGPSDSVEQALMREVSDSGARTVVISSENLWPLLGARTQAVRLFGRLRSLDFEVVLVVYVRNQPQYLNSAYVQNVKTWLLADDFPDFAAAALSQRRKYTYSHWIEFADRYGVEMLARPYSQEVRMSGVTRDFLATIGVSSPGDFTAGIERNVSLGPFSVEVARSLLRRVGGPGRLTDSQAEQCRTAFRAELKKRRIEDRGYCGLTTSFAAEVEQRCAEDNARFSRFAWGKPWHEVFASDLGRSFEPNDYAMTDVPADRRRLLDEVLDSLGPKIDAVTSGSQPSSGRWWTLSALKSRMSG